MHMKGTPITEELFDYIVTKFADEDDLLRHLPEDAARKGVPMIHISPEQGKFLQVLMKIANARRVLEIGSLFGYSTIWMARALPADGKLITLELHSLHAQVTRDNVARAGLSGKVEVREGSATDSLQKMTSADIFDLVFIDADKPGYVAYVDQVLKHVRPGSVIIGDNASASGRVWQTVPTNGDAEFIHAIRAFNDRMATEPRLTSLLVPISDGMCVGVVNS